MNSDMVFGKKFGKTAPQEPPNASPRPDWMHDKRLLPKSPPTRDGRPYSPAHRERVR